MYTTPSAKLVLKCARIWALSPIPLKQSVVSDSIFIVSFNCLGFPVNLIIFASWKPVLASHQRVSQGSEARKRGDEFESAKRFKAARHVSLVYDPSRRKAILQCQFCQTRLSSPVQPKESIPNIEAHCSAILQRQICTVPSSYPLPTLFVPSRLSSPWP